MDEVKALDPAKLSRRCEPGSFDFATTAEARERGVALLRTHAGLGFAAMHDGEVIEPEAFESLPEAEHIGI